MNLFRRKATVKIQKSPARQAAQEAAVGLRETRARRSEVAEVVERLVAIRERNHFAEALRTVFEGGDNSDRRANG